jgi:hypothetical protein
MLVLAMADSDGDPTNGIQLSTAVTSATLGSPVNWNSTNQTTDFAPLQAAVRAADGRSHNWPADAAVTAHFGPRWSCALVGRYAGSISGPTYTDTNGLSQTFSGGWYIAVTPTGVVGDSGITGPYVFDGDFRSTGPLQPGAPSTATLTAVQYVDQGEYAPQVGSPVIPAVTQTFTIDGFGTIGGTWSGGGYSGGQLTFGKRTDMARNNGGATRYQPFSTAVYRFTVYPLHAIATYPNGNSIASIYEVHLEIDNSSPRNVWMYLSNTTGALTDPPSATLASDNSFTVQSGSNDAVQFSFSGTFDPTAVTLTGSLNLPNVTQPIQFNALQGCSMWGGS